MDGSVVGLFVCLFVCFRADHLYAFFVQWRPDIYGDDDIFAEDRGFVVVENVNLEDQAESLHIVDDYFGQFGADFRKDWEVRACFELMSQLVDCFSPSFIHWFSLFG